ncbi:Proline-rich receptor-like protein kinase PERK8 [Senna tora]|uniref:Proline-rich receptor-like protein kinase PERK8 n=1 Tax=Senna tora TaxID=362788 RepID=A0A834WH18_9FABA|nr:Proline-rich receptor-like protein kinase PERK8 [Senna tora]
MRLCAVSDDGVIGFPNVFAASENGEYLDAPMEGPCSAIEAEISINEGKRVRRTTGSGEPGSHRSVAMGRDVNNRQRREWESASPLSYVVIACDATKDRSEHEINVIVDRVRSLSGILSAGYRLLVLGVLYRVPHPMGYQTLACPESFAGTSFRAMEEEVTKKVDAYASMLLPSYKDCDNEGISIEVKVTAGFPIRQVILQEVANYRATWVILDRHLRRDLRFYLHKIPCKVGLVKDDLSVDIWKSHQSLETDVTENKLVYSLAKFVSLSECHSIADIGQSIVSYKSFPSSMVSSDNADTPRSNTKHSFPPREQFFSSDFGSSSKSGVSIKGEYKHSLTSQIVQKKNKYGFIPKSSDAPILCAGCGIRTELYYKESMRFNYSDILHATNEFSKDNLLGEGGYGYVYKGILRDGQQIAAKVRKDESTQGFSEFHSEVYVLSFARHKNIVMLLGYCCKERQNILVYEYICNKSLDWHLFNKDAAVLEWHQRYAIAIGTAKGLRFLHEECRGSPIIHRDMRPSNILLTHDFVAMLGDFGLAKWKTDSDDETMQTRIMGTFGYLAPEYAEDGIVSVRTDVYAYGIVLLQLISGRKVGISDNAEQPSLREWAEPLIEKLAFRELIDPRLGESYVMYELYLMAKAAYFCVQRKPEMRPSMGEVVRLLEGQNDHFHTFANQFVPNYNG